MAQYQVWEVRWTHCAYGGPFTSAQSSYHLTAEEAEAYKAQREGAYDGLKDGFYYEGSRPMLKIVGKAEYKKIKERIAEKK